MKCCVSKVDVMNGVKDGVKERVSGRSKGLPWPTPYVMFAFEKCYGSEEKERKKKEKRCGQWRDDIENGKIGIKRGEDVIGAWGGFTPLWPSFRVIGSNCPIDAGIRPVRAKMFGHGMVVLWL